MFTKPRGSGGVELEVLMATYTMDWVNEPVFDGFNVTPVVGALTEDFLIWQEHPHPVDGGVPPPIATLLAAALCRCGGLLFFGDGRDHASPTMESAARIRVVPVETGILSRLAHRVWRNRVATWTTDPSIAAAMFDMPFYPWSDQGNAALLLHHDVKPDDLPILAGHLWKGRYKMFSGSPVAAVFNLAMMDASLTWPGLTGWHERTSVALWNVVPPSSALPWAIGWEHFSVVPSSEFCSANKRRPRIAGGGDPGQGSC